MNPVENLAVGLLTGIVLGIILGYTIGWFAGKNNMENKFIFMITKKILEIRND